MRVMKRTITLEDFFKTGGYRNLYVVLGAGLEFYVNSEKQKVELYNVLGEIFDDKFAACGNEKYRMLLRIIFPTIVPKMIKKGMQLPDYLAYQSGPWVKQRFSPEDAKIYVLNTELERMLAA